MKLSIIRVSSSNFIRVINLNQTKSVNWSVFDTMNAFADNSTQLEKNVGRTDSVIRLVIGILLIVVPISMNLAPLWVGILAALGGSTILEGIIRY